LRLKMSEPADLPRRCVSYRVIQGVEAWVLQQPIAKLAPSAERILHPKSLKELALPYAFQVVGNTLILRRRSAVAGKERARTESTRREENPDVPRMHFKRHVPDEFLFRVTTSVSPRHAVLPLRHDKVEVPFLSIARMPSGQPHSSI